MSMKRTVPVILLVAGCASAGGASLLTMSDAERERLTLTRQPPPHEKCSQPDEPASYAAPQLVDTGAIASDRSALLGRSDHVVMTLQWDSTGTATALAVIESTISEAGTHALLQQVRLALHLPERAANHRLRIEGDGSMMTAPSVYCMPELQNAESVARMMEHMAIGAGLIGYVPTARTAVVEMHVLADGGKEIKRVVNSSGYPELDAIALEAAKHALYTPASIDGVPMSVYVHQPMYFQLNRRTPPRRGSGNQP